MRYSLELQLEQHVDNHSFAIIPILCVIQYLIPQNHYSRSHRILRSSRRSLHSSLVCAPCSPSVESILIKFSTIKCAKFDHVPFPTVLIYCNCLTTIPILVLRWWWWSKCKSSFSPFRVVFTSNSSARPVADLLTDNWLIWPSGITFTESQLTCSWMDTHENRFQLGICI